MKEACRLGREVLDIAGDCMKPGECGCEGKRVGERRERSRVEEERMGYDLVKMSDIISSRARSDN